MHKETTGAPIYWKLGLFLASCIYLVPELAFNGVLTYVAGDSDSSTALLHNVEIFGRIISSIGTSLLIADLLSTRRLVSTPTKALLYIILVFSIVAPSVYFGQKALIDHLLVEPSSPSSRQNAYHSQIIKTSLSEGIIEIEGLPFGENPEDVAVERTFFSLFGGLLFFNKNILKHIQKDSEEIIKSYVTKKSMLRFDDDYAQYKKLKSNISLKYDAYNKKSDEYYSAINSVPRELKNANRKIVALQKSGWKQYQTSVKRFRNQSRAKAKTLAPKMYKFFDDRVKCKSNNCRKKLDAAYVRVAKKNGFKGIDSNFWLVEKDVPKGEQVALHAALAVFTFGLSALYEGVNYLAGGESETIVKSKEYFYTEDVDHYTKKIMEAKKSSFVRSLGGYDDTITTYLHFKLHPQTQKNTVKNLRSNHGIQVSNSWQLGDDNALGKAIKKLVNQKANNNWSQAVKRQGLEGFKPGLSWDVFQRSAVIQTAIKSKMGGFYVTPVLATWNNTQFNKNVVEPNITKNVKRIQRIIDGSTKEFAYGGSLEKEGKEAVRATLIPLVSMLISLALSILTFGKIIKKLILFVYTRTGFYTKSSRFGKILSTGVIGMVTMVLVLYIPYSTGGNIYSRDSSAVSLLFSELEVSSRASFSIPLKWLLVVQPKIQPIGFQINNYLKLVDLDQ
jgi:hypothetical protein